MKIVLPSKGCLVLVQAGGNRNQLDIEIEENDLIIITHASGDFVVDLHEGKVRGREKK